ncbi:MAG: PD-(D/E)XK nuclease family protein, partial [bacterium]
MNRRLKLFLAPFGCHNGTVTLLQEALGTGVNPEEIFYLTPSPRKLRDSQVLFSWLINRRAFIPPRFTTPRQFARELHEIHGTTRLLPAELKPLIVKFLMKKTSIGYAAIVAKFITDIKRHIPEEEQPHLPERLNNLLAGFEIPLKKVLKAYDTFLTYQQELKSKGWSDDEDILTLAPNFLKEGFLRPRVLILDAFVAPNHLEEKLLTALIGESETVLALGYAGKDADKNYSIASSYIEFLNRFPFSIQHLQPEVCSGTGITESALRFFRFPSIEEEVIGVCSHLRHTLESLSEKEKACFLANTIIATPRLNDYLPFLRRFLRQYGIPFTVYPEPSLASSPPVITVFELLNAINSDFERLSVTAAFSSSFLPKLLRLPDDQDQKPRETAARALNNLSCRAGIIKGEEQWERIAQRITLTEEINPQDAEYEFIADVSKRVRQALGLTKKFLCKEGTVAQQAQNLKQFLETADFCKNVSEFENEDLLKDRQELYDVLDTLAEFAEDSGVVTGTDFALLLSHLLTSRPKTPRENQGGVAVLSMEETLGISPENLYLIGLTETNLPGAYQFDPILPDRVRKELGMPDMDWHRDWQRFHLYRTIYSSRHLPFLSFHESRDNQPVLPTPFLELTPVEPEKITTIYSEMEVQLLNGERNARRFDELSITVDFGHDPGVIKEIQSRFAPLKSLSITMLETYPRCPYRFYVEQVLQLTTPKEPVFEIDSRQWGVILHKVLARLYQKGEVPPEQLPMIAPRILNQVLSESNLPSFWNEVTRAIFNNLLDRFIATENDLRSQGYKPYKTELELTDNLTDDIKLKGRVDRVDVYGETQVRIVDYKSGKANIGASDVII